MNSESGYHSGQWILYEVRVVLGSLSNAPNPQGRFIRTSWQQRVRTHNLIHWQLSSEALMHGTRLVTIVWDKGKDEKATC
eukprot:5091274-Amphidinium_carterae.1